MWLSDTQKIGVGFLGGGVICFLLGIFSLFDARLLSFGNLLFILGVTIFCGVPRTIAYFTARRKRRGAICFIIGVIMVVRKWTFSGFMVELFGIASLYAELSGVIIAVLRQTPVIGAVLNHAAVSPYVDRFATGNILPR